MPLSVELLKDNYETLFFSVIVGVGLTAGKNSTFPQQSLLLGKWIDREKKLTVRWDNIVPIKYSRWCKRGVKCNAFTVIYFDYGAPNTTEVRVCPKESLCDGKIGERASL